ncbi:hypothetical protein E2C01_076957 [Portunus trituberculatus]|uniref:Uncharacterized protein n=1 Tax=Portunus trituberculatus TaxID=210409 RepID=A0A5B7IJX0_PORTR|nr:hypothetical protein [Portunus trituberculatus]
MFAVRIGARNVDFFSGQMNHPLIVTEEETLQKETGMVMTLYFQVKPGVTRRR